MNSPARQPPSAPAVSLSSGYSSASTSGGLGGYSNVPTSVGVGGYGGGGRAPPPVPRPAQPVQPTPLVHPSVAPSVSDNFARLDGNKQRALLRVLDTQLADTAVGASASFSASESSSALPKLGTEICVRALTNWGDARQAGLSHLEILDMNGKMLRIPPAALS